MTNPHDPINPIDAMSVVDPKTNIHGLTKREHFAAMAMQGVMFWDATVNEPHETGKIEQLAEQSVNMADAVIAALNKPISDEVKS